MLRKGCSVHGPRRVLTRRTSHEPQWSNGPIGHTERVVEYLVRPRLPTRCRFGSGLPAGVARSETPGSGWTTATRESPRTGSTPPFRTESPMPGVDVPAHEREASVSRPQAEFVLRR